MKSTYTMIYTKDIFHVFDPDMFTLILPLHSHWNQKKSWNEPDYPQICFKCTGLQLALYLLWKKAFFSPGLDRNHLVIYI